MKKFLNGVKVSMLIAVLALITTAFVPSLVSAQAEIEVDTVACWEPGGSACSVTTSCGVGCTQTQNYKNWIIIFTVE